MEKKWKADPIESLLDQYGIIEKELVDYANAHHDEISRMEEIFDLSTQEQYNICLTIPELLAPESADDIKEYFKEEKQGTLFIKEAKPDTEKYRLLLIAAFNFNPAFFAMAWNWCRLIKNELAKGAVKRQKEPERTIIRYSERFRKRFPRFKQEKREFNSVYFKLETATSSGHKEGAGYYEEGIGEFKPLYNLGVKKKCLQLRFIPAPELKTNEGEVYTIKVVVINCNKKYHILLSSENIDEGSITSEKVQGEDIDYDKGIYFEEILIDYSDYRTK